ncbi:MAG: hypothetical protein JEZ12_12985 [Desulfobacterium sp.]|nr:hypothetical protein [Desulfobacterium sp.]
MEKPNWHYYETDKGEIFHFRKEHMVAVLEGDVKKNLEGDQKMEQPENGKDEGFEQFMASLLKALEGPGKEIGIDGIEELFKCSSKSIIEAGLLSKDGAETWRITIERVSESADEPADPEQESAEPEQMES